MRGAKEKFWEFQAKSSAEGALFLYGDIAQSSWYGDEVTPQAFREELDALGDISTLHVYINSGGGDVFAGCSIISMLQRHKARTIGYNDGLAASMAFHILMAMDEVVAAENSIFMTHNCSVYTYGDRHFLRERAEMMEKMDGMVAEIAAKKSGKTVEEIMALQDAETWYTATEAVEAGFVDRIQEGNGVAASVDGGFFVVGNERFDLSRYRHPPMAPDAECTMTAEEAAERIARGCSTTGKNEMDRLQAEMENMRETIETACGMTLEEAMQGIASGMEIENRMAALGLDIGACCENQATEQDGQGLTEPDNGGESQPVEDMQPSTELVLGSMAEQRETMDRIRRKLLGGYENG